MSSRKESERNGLAERKRMGRSKLAELAPRKFDPVDIVGAACKDHVPKLIPVKFERMSVSPFAYFRGAVEVMAADLAAAKSTRLEAQLCGDAHLKNFGFYSTPASDIILDINDFDQTTRGPWEWDVKRCATSIVLAGRLAGCADRGWEEAARLFLVEYCQWIHKFAAMTVLEVARHRALRKVSDPRIKTALKEAERSTPCTNLAKLTRRNRKHGYRFRYQPKLIWEVHDVKKTAVLAALPEYRRTLAPDHQMIFDRYQVADVGFKVVGTGSVGTRDYVVLMFGRDREDPLFLQIKEEPPSAYAPYLNDPACPSNHGERVVRGQRAMQVLSDVLLGWCSIEGRDYLVRQLNDHKSSIDPEELGDRRLAEYSRVCAELLAKAHARSGDPVALASYLGRSEKAERVLLQFAIKYADKTEADYQIFRRALKRGFLEEVMKSIAHNG